jgi:D-glycero-D-manno-heptose 1,7-bisphosphate phosphatase
MNTDNKKTPAVFLDRDGTLIEEVNFLHRVEDLRLFDFTDEAVRLLKEFGFFVIVLTNQSGIDRRIYTEGEMHLIHDAIQERLSLKLDKFYFCPHLPDAGCRCRKPALGMIEDALHDFDIDMENSWMIGDKEIDVQLAQNAGIKSALVLTGYGEEDRHKLRKRPDIIAANLLEAVKKIIE